MDEYRNNQRNPLLSVLLLLPLIVAIFVVAIIVINMIILIKSVGTVILAIEGFFSSFVMKALLFIASPFFNFSDFYLAFSLSDNCSTYCYILRYIIATYATYPHAKQLLLLFVIHCLSPYCPIAQ